MSGWVAGAALVGAVIGYASSRKSDKVTKSGLDDSQAKFQAGQAWMNREAEWGMLSWQAGMDQMWQTANIAEGQSNSYQAESGDYKRRAQAAQTEQLKYYENMMDNFQGMLGDNADMLNDFNSTYGNIMDNVKQGIMDVSAPQLAASGREQLSFDMETLSTSFDEARSIKGIANSGLTVEQDMRLQAETAQQARAIDVNSNAQAMQLQGQGIQNLNSMTDIGRNIQNQGINIQGQMGNAMGNMSNLQNQNAMSFYGASQNMFGKGYNNLLNSSTNVANMYGQRGLAGIQGATSFYSGVAQNAANSVSQGYTNQANNLNADAAGYGKFAGNMLANYNYNTNSNSGYRPQDDGTLY